MILKFHDAKKELPPREKWSELIGSRLFLIRTEWDSWFITTYADGWNLYLNPDGSIFREHEIHGCKAWAELPEDFPCDDCVEDCPVKED